MKQSTNKEQVIAVLGEYIYLIDEKTHPEYNLVSLEREAGYFTFYQIRDTNYAIAVWPNCYSWNEFGITFLILNSKGLYVHLTANYFHEMLMKLPKQIIMKILFHIDKTQHWIIKL